MPRFNPITGGSAPKPRKSKPIRPIRPIPPITPQDTTRRAARKAQFKTLWAQVAAMPEHDRIQLANKLGFRNVSGHEFSLANSILLALQHSTGSVFGGFRQWLKQGRAVRKGEHGAMIWVPAGKLRVKSGNELSDGGAPESGPSTLNPQPSTHFVIGTIFDISQTDELSTEPVTGIATVPVAVSGVPLETLIPAPASSEPTRRPAWLQRRLTA